LTIGRLSFRVCIDRSANKLAVGNERYYALLVKRK
jgi:hypothetical protein